MRYLIAILSIAALVCVAGSANAFTGCERWGYTDIGSATNPYMLYAIPDEYVPAIDGDLADVGWMPEGMYFTLDTCPEVTEAIAEGNVPRDSFDMIVYGPAWVPATNSLYFGVRKVDDILYAPHPDITACWAEDCQQWYTDPSGAGGNYREEQNCNTAQQNFYTPKDGGHLSHFGPVEYDWRFEAPNGFFVQTLDEATGSYDMEVMYKLWDWLDESEEASTLHIFEVDQLIGLGFSVRDVDIEGDVKKRANWQSADVWTDASLFPAFMVRPVSDTYALMATEPSTWGGIKAMFK
ncbi:MAG: hypothetical protein KAV99_02245 [Candidatus Latescibacteria bacterium]|nr:hypothetical protein [Candidatus Latescibacterota bacterium]